MKFTPFFLLLVVAFGSAGCVATSSIPPVAYNAAESGAHAKIFPSQSEKMFPGWVVAINALDNTRISYKGSPAPKPRDMYVAVAPGRHGFQIWVTAFGAMTFLGGGGHRAELEVPVEAVAGKSYRIQASPDVPSLSCYVWIEDEATHTQIGERVLAKMSWIK